LTRENSGRADRSIIVATDALPKSAGRFRLMGNDGSIGGVMSRRIEIYDTTLRDGTQGEGFNLSLQDKLSIAKKLDELGMDYIEGGFPLSNPKDEAFFREVRSLNLKNATVAAFGMTRRRGMAAKDDPGMKALLDAQTPVITVVGKSSEFQATAVLGVSAEENVKMIGD